MYGKCILSQYLLNNHITLILSSSFFIYLYVNLYLYITLSVGRRYLGDGEEKPSTEITTLLFLKNGKGSFIFNVSLAELHTLGL